MSDPIRIISKVRNNRLMEAREQIGMSAPQFAEQVGMSYGLYIRIEGLKQTPSEWAAALLSEATGIGVDELFPSYLDGLKTTTSVRTIPESKMLSLTGLDPYLLTTGPEDVEDNVNKRELKEALNKSLGELVDRERFIIESRFGLNGDDPMTLESVGKILGVSKERIREIEAKAMKKLRHPRRSRRLRVHVMDVAKTREEFEYLHKYRAAHNLEPLVMEPL